MMKKFTSKAAALMGCGAFTALTAFAALAPFHALAQTDWPTRPVTLVVQAAAGGGNDAVARKLAEQMRKILGQPVVVDNRGGAGGAIGSESVARANPDGYTLLLLTTGETYYKVLNPSVKFDVANDFVPISMVASAPLILAVNSTLPLNSLADVVAYAKANPGKLSYETAGIGSPHHMAGEMLSKAANVNLLHVPYRGTALAMNDLIANQVSMAWSSPIALSAFVDAGKVRPIIVADSKRIPSYPNVPTASESGYADVKFDNWFGVVAPKGTPPAVIKKLSDAISLVGHDAAFTTRLKEMGFQPMIQGPEEFGARIRQDRDKYTRIAQGLKAQ